VPEPPVPAGLAELSGPLRAVADFLRLDSDLLVDLQALAVREGGIFEFAEQITRLRERHSRKPSLIDRLDRARLD
jgi:hypothetical protein